VDFILTCVQRSNARAEFVRSAVAFNKKRVDNDDAEYQPRHFFINAMYATHR
jgi:hypothetical protein